MFFYTYVLSCADGHLYGGSTNDLRRRTAEHEFGNVPATAPGFMRVSMSPTYRANYADAQKVLASLTSLPSAAFPDCGVPTAKMSAVTSHKDITDCYLVELARQHSCRFATLDEGILNASWVKGVAFLPLKR